MKFSYKFTNLLGSVYKKGNLLFSPDGNTVISPVGNRISFFDLKNNKCETLPIESRYNFTTIALAPNGCILIAVNETGEALLCSLISRTVLHKYHFKRPIKDIKFSPDGKYFAVTKENSVFLYTAPGPHTRKYNPFSLEKVFHSSYDDTTCIDWTSDSRVIAVGGQDMTTKIYAVQKFANLSIYTLGSHSDHIVGCFFEKNSLDLYTVSRNGQLCIWECSVDLANLIPLSKKEEVEVLEDEEDNETEKEKALVEDSTEKVYYKRIARHHMKDAVKADGYVTLSAAAYNTNTHILVSGFSNGAFLLHEMPEYNLIHSLVNSESIISSLAFNCTGDWIAIGCSGLGQLIVWEWQSESFVLKQQGQFNNLSSLSYSPDGQYIVSGGDDGKVKVWNTSSGFCFVTFTEHSSCITGVTFTQNGKVIISASLDGTVRAYDLQRYRNFRTFTSPRPTQFFCLTVDPSGEFVCAGSQDSYEIFVWSMKTGRLLEVLSGHEAPVSAISFSPSQTLFVSVSWDKTVRIWDIFENKGRRETITLTSDGLALQYRPDGREIAVATLDGQISFFNVETCVQTGSIEGRNDLGSGRRDTDLITAKKLLQGQAFTTLCYSADGEVILAAGRSKNVCIYHVAEQILLKKFEISCNHSFDAIDDFISRRKMTEYGNKALVEEREDETSVAISLPGVRKGDMSSRSFKPEVRVTCVQFSPTGRSWAMTSTEGLLVYSLDHALIFEPFELETDITPEAIRNLLKKEEYSKAIIMAFHLNERDIIIEAVERTPITSVELLAQCLPHTYVEKMLKFLGSQLETTQHIEFYLMWIQHLLSAHGPKLKERSSSIMPVLRTLQKNLTRHHQDLRKLYDHNKYLMEYIISVGETKRRQQESSKKETAESSFPHDEEMEESSEKLSSDSE